MICHPWVNSAFPTINQPTKCEVSISTHYEDMKGNKCGKWGGLGH